MRCAWGMWAAVILLAAVGSAMAADLAFRPDGEGYFRFDTGALRGRMRADGKSQGIVTLVHEPSGKELASSTDWSPGILSYYRVLGRDWRYGDIVRHWPVRARLVSDGALEISWPSAESHPFGLRAVYRWTAPEVLDVETICTPDRAMPDAEVFFSSYFSEGSDTVVYAAPSFHFGGKPRFLPADCSPLVEGTYLFFPRDRAVTRLIYDRRWEFPPHPVQWSVTQRLAAPMAMRRAKQGGPSVLLMSPAEDCFAIAAAYNRTPPDRIAAHRSIYLSLFGRDLKAGEAARARVRMVVGDVTPETALGLYARYCEELGIPWDATLSPK